MTRRMLILTATVAICVAAMSATAFAAGQAICVGRPGSSVSAPNAEGKCSKNYSLVTLGTESEVSSLKTENETLKKEVEALQTKLSKVSYEAEGLNGKPTLKITGANLQIVNGVGVTRSKNGLGNLVLGYDENESKREQTGSHNLVTGEHLKFTSSGGLIDGIENELTGAYGVVFGIANTAGTASSVTGGFANKASGLASSVSGGEESTASGEASSVSGGERNVASGAIGSVSGGYKNTASGTLSSILGGKEVTLSSEFGTSP